MVTSNYLVNNDCPRITLSDKLFDNIALFVTPDVRTIILKYKTDKNFRRFPDDFEPLKLVPDTFMPEGDIPPSPAFGRKKKTNRCKKCKKCPKRSRKKSKRKKTKRKKTKRKSRTH